MKKKTLFKKGLQAEEAFVDRLKVLEIPFEKFGREHKIKSPYFKQQLNKDYSKTACHIRFTPDFLFYTNKEFFFAEVKASRTIEKHCFENYLLMEEGKINILIFFFVNGVFYSCKPSEVPFSKNYETGKKFEKHLKAGVLMPVVENWVCPRKMKLEDFMKWKSCTGGSGQPYANISIPGIKKLSKL